MTSGHWSGLTDSWEELNHSNLHGRNTNNYCKEEVIVEDLLEDVEILSSDLSAVDLIEYLQEDESVKDIGVVEKLGL